MSGLPALLERFERDLRAGDYVAYLPQPLVHELDDRVRAVVDAYAAADADARALLECLPAGAAGVFLAFAERQASLAVRTAAPQALPPAVAALGLAATLTDDDREAMLVMPLPWQAALRLGVAAPALFAEAASGLPDAGAQALLAFARRAPDDQTLACMGYEEGADGDGFRYRRTW